MLRYDVLDDILEKWYVNAMIYDIVWYVHNMLGKLEDMMSYEMTYVWHEWYIIRLTCKWRIDMRYNPDIRMKYMIKWYDIKKNVRGVVIHDNKWKNVGTSYIIVCSCIGGYPYSFYDGTNTYITKQGNNHYVYHNATTMVDISNECPASTTNRECLPDMKGAQEVYKPTGGSILARA